MKIKAGQTITPTDILAAVWKSNVAMSDEVFDKEESFYFANRSCGCWFHPCKECDEEVQELAGVREFYVPALNASSHWMNREVAHLTEESDDLPQWMNEAIRWVR